MTQPVFVIGDVHGHVDRLVALLDKAKPHKKDGLVIQLGDLAHVGADTKYVDREVWALTRMGAIDIVLWGNHDRSAVDQWHAFGGFAKPLPETVHIMNIMEREGRLKIAHEAHGWLLTHAGLHKQFKHQKIPADALGIHPQLVDKESAASIAAWLNRRYTECAITHTREPVIDAVGRKRGGASPYGGILWRDITEKLWLKVPQIFGHSASRYHIVRGEEDKWYCIDIGGKGGPSDLDAECLAGMWLPSQEIVRVDIHKEEKHEDV